MEIKVAGEEIKFEIDTGAGITIISEESYNTHFSDMPLTKADIRIKTYTNESIEVVGKLKVEVECKGRLYRGLDLLVLKGSGVNLLGRDWLQRMSLKLKYFENL